METKYGIRHDNGKIIAITEFLDGKVAEGFVEITKTDYDRFIAALASNPFSTYDEASNELIGDTDLLEAASVAHDRDKFRGRLLALSNELELMTKLGEDVTERQSEFDALEVQYRALKPQ